MNLKFKKTISILALFGLLSGLSWLFLTNPWQPNVAQAQPCISQKISKRESAPPMRKSVPCTPETELPSNENSTAPKSAVDLTISKSANSPVVQPGDTLTYTIIYSNVGSTLATGVVITDIVPPEIGGAPSGTSQLPLTYLSSGATITPTVGPDFVWLVEDLSPGEGGIITISGQVSSTNNVITNTAIIAGLGDGNLSNNSSQVIVKNFCSVITQPIQIAFVMDRSGSTADNDVYTQSIQALHNSVDTLFPEDEAAIISFSSDVTTHTLGFIGDQATLHTAVDTIPAPAGDTYMADALQAAHTLFINQGDLNTTQVIVLLSDGQPTQGSGDPVPIAGAIKEDGIIIISVGVGSGIDQDLMTQIASAGQAYFAEAANQLGEIFSQLNQTIRCTADLAIDKTVNETVIPVGQPVTFTLNFANYGPGLAQNVIITDVIPAGISDLSWHSNRLITPTGNVSYTWLIGNLIPNESGTIIIAGTVNDINAITNTAAISSTTLDVILTNNQDQATVSPPPLASADVRLQKDVTPAVANPGETVTFTLTFSNYGPSLAENVVITDLLPPEIANPSWASTYPVTATGGFSYTWQVGHLPAGQGGSIVIVGTLAEAGTITNTATITTTTLDVLPDNNQATATITNPLPLQADVHIDKYVNQTTANPGEVIIFTLTFANSGPDIATDVVVSDIIPPSLANVVWSSNRLITLTGSTNYTWQIGNLMSGESGFIVIVGNLTEAGTITNTATITSTTLDPDPTNNAAQVTVSTPPLFGADLAVTKMVNTQIASVGDVLTFTLTFTNNGPTIAQNVQLSDIIPPQLSNVSWSSTRMLTATGGPDYSWLVGSLAPGEGGQVTIIGQVNQAGTVTNIAAITSTTTDLNLANNSATVIVTNPDIPQADLQISKRINRTTASPGDTIIYTLLFANNGPAMADNVVITDIIPAELANLSWSSSFPVTPTGNTPYTWQVGNLAPGENGVIVVVGDLTEGYIITNTATITSTTLDPVPTNNTSQVTVAIVYNLNITIIGEGAVAIDVNGVKCENDCTITYPANTPLNLTAIPDLDWGLFGWTGDLTSSNFIESLMMNDNKDITCEFCQINKPIRGVLVFDASGSMYEELEDAKAAGDGFVDFFALDEYPNRELAIVEFSDIADLLQSLTNDTTLLHTAINGIRLGGQTYMVPALQMAYDQLQDYDNDDRFVVFLSDGEPSEYPNEVLQKAEELKNDGIRIISVGLGDQVDQYFLENLASSPDLAFMVTNSSDLFEVYQHIAGLVGCEAWNFELAFNKTVNATSIPFGEAVTYTITFSNPYPGLVAGDVVISDVIPLEVVSGPGGTGSLYGPIAWWSHGVIVTPTGTMPPTWQVEDLTYGNEGTIILTGIVSGNVSQVITNTAYIIADVFSPQMAHASFQVGGKNVLYIPALLKNKGQEFFDNMESGPGNWTIWHDSGSIDWSLNGGNPFSGSNAWFAEDADSLSDQYLGTAHPILLNDLSNLEFWHYYDTEANYDGGVIEISTDGVIWVDLGQYITQNGYNDHMVGSSALSGRNAFGGYSNGYIQTIVDLSSYSGQQVFIRFRMASDGTIGSNGWYVDDVRITNSIAPW